MDQVLLLTHDFGFLMSEKMPANSLTGQGWQGFTDTRFMISFVGRLLLAILLAAVIAYHPKVRRKYDSLEDAEAPKSFILYSFVAAIIGTAVMVFGGIVGFVVFGIGGLLRFRTNVGSATQTGRVILATVIGLCAGLDLLHVAIISTIFGFLLIWILDCRRTYCMVVQGIHKGKLVDATTAYRAVLEGANCRILGERKNISKNSMRLIFRGPEDLDHDQLQEKMEFDLPEKYHGAIDWEWL